MKKRLIMIVTGIAVVGALVLGGVAIAGSQSVGPLGDDEASLSGPAADRATATAIKVTGGGKANALERDSEHGATYEVEVTKPNGKTVDVYLVTPRTTSSPSTATPRRMGAESPKSRRGNILGIGSESRRL
jgi:hypothetical protein